MIRVLGCASIMLFLTGTVALSQSADLTVAGGHCAVFRIGNANHGCGKLLYTHFPNGRTGFNIPTSSGAIMLSGGRDSQPTLTTYHLEIDTLRLGSADGTSRALPANGRCTARLSADGAYLHGLVCRAHSGTTPIVVQFVGDGRRVSVSKL